MKRSSTFLSSVFLGFCFSSSLVANAATCKSVRGGIDETLTPPSACTSPVGLCTTGNIYGDIKGQFKFTASAILNSNDTSVTNVVFVTGDNVINATYKTRKGTVTAKSAAVFRTSDDGELSDVQIITGGTGGFAGVTGSLQLVGNFVNGIGFSSFEGTVCFP